jgi:AraC-like DNA-binding protein
MQPDSPLKPAEPAPIFRWSTHDLLPQQRLNCYVDVLCSELMNVTTSSSERDGFHAEVTVARLGETTVATMGGSMQDSFRTKANINRSLQHSYYLTVGVGSEWRWATSGSKLRLRPGDLLLTDTRMEQSYHWSQDCLALAVSLSIDALPDWIPQPQNLVGRRIAADSHWGRVLSHFVTQLTPEQAVNAPVPGRLVTDHVGALLALASMQYGAAASAVPAARILHARILDCVKQRCTEFALTAPDVAAALKISTRTLHRCLAAHGETFGAQLIDARVERAIGMLRSRAFDRVTTAEIGRRAGFSDASHFARATRKRLGLTPVAVRRARLA